MVGTHVQIGSERGAELNLLASSQVVTDNAGTCFSADLCALLAPLLKWLPKTLSCNTGVCHNSQTRISDEHLLCAFRGGDPQATFECDPQSWTNTSRTNFLLSGDPTQPASTYRYRWEEVSVILDRMGLPEAAQALDLLSSFRACHGEGRLWKADSTGVYKCECNLQCGNGQLQKDSCTCECPGDAWHGWAGATCATTYGKCIKGKGTGGVDPFHAVGHACDSGNECSTSTASTTCKATVA